MDFPKYLIAPVLALLLAACASHVGSPAVGPVASMPSATPVVLPALGDTAVYRVINAYNGEVRGDVRYRVERVDREAVVVSVVSNATTEGLPHTEIYTPDGNWLRHPVINHNIPVEYDFAPAYPAYPFPLAVGKSWSSRVNASGTAQARRGSVRVDGRVLGVERLTTPAGTFDTYKIRRQIYAGDWDGFLAETNITEIEWYAPGLGRAVRTERNSTWLDRSRTGGERGLFGGGFMEMRGEWSVYELVSYARAG